MDLDEDDEETQQAKDVKDYGIEANFEDLEETEQEVTKTCHYRYCLEHRLNLYTR